MSRRTQRVNELLRQEMSRVIQVELRDPRLHSLISITYVDTSEDLRYAKVHVSVLGDTSQKASALHGLDSAAGYIRKELGVVLPLRYIPRLTFVLDESLEKSEAIQRAINSMVDDEALSLGKEPTDDPSSSHDRQDGQS